MLQAAAQTHGLPFAQRNVAKFVVFDKDDGNLTIGNVFFQT
jgi:hypothetical protein